MIHIWVSMIILSKCKKIEGEKYKSNIQRQKEEKQITNVADKSSFTLNSKGKAFKTSSCRIKPCKERINYKIHEKCKKKSHKF